MVMSLLLIRLIDPLNIDPFAKKIELPTVNLVLLIFSKE